MSKHKICPAISRSKKLVTFILNRCIADFGKNIYVVGAAQQSTNILQGEGDESLSLGKPMQPQEEHIEEQKDEENDEQLEEEEK